MHLGIDPGTTGGAVLVCSEGGFVACWHWKRSGSGWALAASNEDRPPWGVFGSLGALKAALLEAVRWTTLGGPVPVTVESLYVPKDSKLGPSFIVLAEAAGIALGACQAAGHPVLYRPNATQWRAKLIPAAVGKTRAVAEAYALEHIGARLDLPEPWSKNIHVVEAGLIALYGHHKTLHSKERA